MSVISQFNNWYVSGAQCSIYIGDYLLDNALQVSFNLDTSPNPIYSAFDTVYRAVAPGQAIVQGVISAAFVSEGYIETLVSKFKEMKENAADIAVVHSSNGDTPNGQSQGSISVTNRGQSTPMTIASLVAQDGQNDSGGSELFNAYKRGLQERYWGASKYTARSVPELYRTPFKVVVYYGDIKEQSDRDEIFDVIITNKSKQIDNSGAPIGENYQFIGKMLI